MRISSGFAVTIIIMIALLTLSMSHMIIPLSGQEPSIAVLPTASSLCAEGTAPPLCLNETDTTPLPKCLQKPPTCLIGEHPHIKCSAPTKQACDYFPE